MFERPTMFHTAISVDIDRFSDATLLAEYLPIFTRAGVASTLVELRAACAAARAKGLEVFPPCDHVLSTGMCAGHAPDAPERFSRGRRDAVRAATVAASRAPGVTAVFVVVQTSDGFFTAGGQHPLGNAHLAHLGSVGVGHMRAELQRGANGSEHDDDEDTR